MSEETKHYAVISLSDGVSMLKVFHSTDHDAAMRKGIELIGDSVEGFGGEEQSPDEAVAELRKTGEWHGYSRAVVIWECEEA